MNASEETLKSLLLAQTNGTLLVNLLDPNGGGSWGVSSNPIITSSPSPLVYTNFGTAASALILTGARKLRGFVVTNSEVTAYYFQIINKATAPVVTDAPGAGGLSILMPAGSILGIGADILSDTGIDMTLGLGFAWSPTASSFTAGATANLHSTTVFYK